MSGHTNGLHGLAALSVLKYLTLQVPETKITGFANSIDSDEAAQISPSHQDLHCLPSSHDAAWKKHFF